MLKFLGRGQRIDSKMDYIVEYMDLLHGREKIDVALMLAQKISQSSSKRALEKVLDDFIEDMGYITVGFHNVGKLKLHHVVKMELAPDRKGDPVMQICDSNDDDELMFYEFPLCQGFEVHICNEFLRSIDEGNELDICFQTYCQYGQLIWKCFDLLKRKQKATA